MFMLFKSVLMLCIQHVRLMNSAADRLTEKTCLFAVLGFAAYNT